MGCRGHSRMVRNDIRLFIFALLSLCMIWLTLSLHYHPLNEHGALTSHIAGRYFLCVFLPLFVNDQTGPIGAMLRATFPEYVRMGLDEATFAAVFVSLFMQIMGLLQMPDFFGPSFSPFVVEKLRLWQNGSASSSKQNGSRQKAQQAVASKPKVKKT